MEYLKAPTDNLYKFIAIAGAALIAVCVIQTTTQLAEISQQSFQIAKDTAILKVEAESLNERFKASGKEHERLFPEQHTPEKKTTPSDRDSEIQQKNEVVLDSASEKMQSSAERVARIGRLEAFRQENDAILDLAFQRLLSAAVLDVQGQRIRELASAFVTWVRIGVFTVGIGILMMILGFCLWYSRVQVFQDRLLQKQASEQAPKS